jgi:hypothetical protein
MSADDDDDDDDDDDRDDDDRRRKKTATADSDPATATGGQSRAQLESKVERIEEVQDSVLAEQKEMLLILFQRIVILLSNHFTRCEEEGLEGAAVNTTWLHRTLGHFKEIARLYRSEISSFMSTLDTVVFSASSVDARLTSVFAQIKEAPFLVH